MYGAPTTYGAVEYGGLQTSPLSGYLVTPTETVTAVDSLVKHADKTLLETVTAVDAVVKKRIITLLESIGTNDSVLRIMGGVTAGIWERVDKVTTIWTRTNKPN